MTQAVERDREILERIEDPEKYTGYVLYDPLNKRVGVVETVFTSEFGEPQYIRVKLKSGLFGSVSILLPVERVAVEGHRTALILQ